MAVVGELLVLIGANNAALTGALASSEAQLTGFSAHASSSMAVVRTAALGVGAAAVIGMGIGVNAAMDFQEQMATINTIARQTPDELNRTGDAIRALSVATGSSLPDLTSSFYDLLSVGVPVGQAMEFLTNATTLSIGGLSTSKEAVDAITVGINAWSGATGAANLTMADSAKVMDIFAKAIELGGLTAADIGPAMSNVAALASSMNTPIEQVAAAMALMTTRGFSASEATTSMNAAFTALQRVPPGMEELQEKTGKSYEQIARTQGIHEAITQLVADADKFNVGMVDVFGRVDALGFVLNTTGGSAKAYEGTLASMYASTGTAAGQAEERMGTFSRGMAILGASVTTVAISVGTGLLPPLTDFVASVSEVVQSAGEWASQNPALVSSILPITAAIAAVVVVALSLGVIFGVIGTALGVILSPIVLIGGAIVGLAAHFGLLGDGAKSAFDGIAATILGAIPGIVATLGRIAAQIVAWISAQLPVWVAQLGQWASAFVGWIVPMIPPLLGALGRAGVAIIAWIAAEAPRVLAALGQLAIQFVAWVLPMIPPLLVALGQVAVELVAWIVRQIPVIAGALLKMKDAFLGWIVASIPGLVANLATWLQSLLGWMAGVPAQLGKAAEKFGKGIFDGIMDGLKGIAAAVAAELSKIPGISLVGDIGNNLAGAIPKFSTGATIGTTGLAVVHAGETITPAGQAAFGGGGSAAQTQLTNHTHVYLDGKQVGEALETMLFNQASGFSSGFSDSPVSS